jgi:hypothetical protein
MINDLFAIHYFPQRIVGWAEKKAELLKYISEYDFERGDAQPFLSDRTNDGRSYIQPFCKIFSEELNEFGKAAMLSRLDVLSIWTIKYENGDYHPAHNHRSAGYSGILYLDYDAELHTPSTYICPFNNPVSDRTQLFTPEVKEGDLIIFPSSVLHYCAPNASDMPRRIVSFDMSVS